jgi:hypothetical protein
MSNRYYSPEGNLEVWEKKPKGYYTEAEWQELHPAPPAPEPTTDEKIAALDAKYEADKAEIISAYQTALVYGNTDRMEQIKADLVALDDKYDEDYEAIVGEE